MITAKRDDLNTVLRLAERAAERKDHLPVRCGALLDARTQGALTVTATDLEIGLRSTITVSGDGGWARVVDASLFAKLVGRLSCDEIHLAASESQVEVRSGGARFVLPSLPPDDFPELPAPKPRAVVRMAAGVLAGVLGRIAFAAADSDQRPVLNGVLFEAAEKALALAATDSSRLATETLELLEPSTATSQPVRVIVPARSVSEMIRVLDAVPPASEAVIELGERIVMLRAGAFTLTTRLIEGNFPPYRQVILIDPPHTVSFSRAALLDAVARLSLLARRGPAVVMFEPGEEPGMVRLRAAVADAGDGVEVIRLDGGSTWPTDMRVAYQARFLEDFLRAVREPTVRYSVADPARQGQWTAGGLTYVVMPWRIDDSAVAQAA